MTQTVTHLYETFAQAEAAVRALEGIGIDKGDISIISHRVDDEHAPAHVRDAYTRTAAEASSTDAAAGGAIGGILGGAGGALAGLGMLAIPGIGPVVAAGWLATAAAGALVGGAAGAGAGGIIGALTNAGVSDEEAHVYAESVRRGDTLVSAKVADDQFEAAQRVLGNSAFVAVADRRRAYEDGGWRRFDSDATVYSGDEIARERESRMRTY